MEKHVLGVESDTSLGIEGGGSGGSEEIGGDNLVLSVAIRDEQLMLGGFLVGVKVQNELENTL